MGEPAGAIGAARPRSGPLRGVRFVEFAGIGPVPFAAMVLADLGAEGIRLEPPTPGLFAGDPTRMPTNRGRASVALDLKHRDGVAAALRLVDQADVVLEGFRPGVMERLGVGPQVCLARQPRLVYARMTGWGQQGPLAQRAGHDLTYLAVAGALAHFARSGQPPTAPLNLVADYGGGGMLLVAGVLAALVETGRSGQGQVVDVAMVDGVAQLMAVFHGLRAQGLWRDEPGTNLLDTGAPFYDVYRAKDGGYLAVGALEPQFYQALLAGLGLAEEDLPDQYDLAGWPVLRSRFTEVFASRTRAEWTEQFAGTDACVAPVLSMAEAPAYPHLAARGTFVEVDGVVQPAPAPRFSRTPAASPPDRASEHGADSARLLDWGFQPDELVALRLAGVLHGPRG
ncbi:MAG TPA: CaiB/BaiF CoA-transferase family protein [Micromonosporaceae bacterium]